MAARRRKPRVIAGIAEAKPRLIRRRRDTPSEFKEAAIETLSEIESARIVARSAGYDQGFASGYARAQTDKAKADEESALRSTLERIESFPGADREQAIAFVDQGSRQHWFSISFGDLRRMARTIRQYRLQTDGKAFVATEHPTAD